MRAISRSSTVAALLLVPALLASHPASANAPGGHGEILSPTAGGEFAQRANVTVSYDFPDNTTSGNVTVDLRIGNMSGPLIGRSVRPYDGNATVVITTQTYVPSSVPAGQHYLLATFRYVSATNFTAEVSDAIHVLYQGPQPNRPPTIQAVHVAYEVGLGFVVRVNATDPDPLDVLRVEIESDLADAAYPRGDAWVHPVEPESLGDVALDVTVWDSAGAGAGLRVIGTVVGMPVEVLNATVALQGGIHANMQALHVPPRLLEGRVEIDCALDWCMATAVALVWNDRPTEPCLSASALIRFESDEDSSGCRFEAPHAALAAQLVRLHGPGDVARVRVTAIAV